MKYVFFMLFSISVVFAFSFGISCVYGYLFPVLYMDEISAASEQFGVEEEIIYAMINIESGFDKNALSSKGAVGLMQILPSTAADMASRLGMSDFDLQNPDDNITLGTMYISQMLDRYDDLQVALCSYNAGPGNVSSWLSMQEYSSNGKTLDKIPFEETQNYLKKFETNLRYYQRKI